MIAKKDSLTRLVERTAGQADVVKPLVRPFFSPGTSVMGIREGLSAQSTEISMDNRTFMASDSAFLTPTLVDGTPISPISHPDPGASRGLLDTPLLNTKGDRPGKDNAGRELPIVRKNKNSLMKGLRDQQEMEINRDKPGKDAAGRELLVERKNRNLPMKGLRDQQEMEIKGDRQLLDIEVNRVLQPPLLSNDRENTAGPADVAEFVSPLPQPEPGEQIRSVIESLKNRQHYQTGSYARKESKMAGEPAATPVVRVTIGSIDVRAVMQQAMVQQPLPIPEPVKPKLSLEEYLRQRDGGER